MDEKKINVKIYTPERIVVDEEADFAAVTTTNASNGFLPRHVPYIMMLSEKGQVRIKKGNANKIFKFEGSGHMEYKDQILVILTESVSLPA